MQSIFYCIFKVKPIFSVEHILLTGLLIALVFGSANATTGIQAIGGLRPVFILLISAIGFIPFIINIFASVHSSIKNGFRIISLLWIIPTVIYIFIALFYLYVEIYDEYLNYITLFLGFVIALNVVALLFYFYKVRTFKTYKTNLNVFVSSMPERGSKSKIILFLSGYLFLLNIYSIFKLVVFNKNVLEYLEMVSWLVKMTTIASLVLPFIFIVASILLFQYKEIGRKFILLLILLSLCLQLFGLFSLEYLSQIPTIYWVKQLYFGLTNIAFIYLLTRKNIKSQFS